jgi:dTDP-4-amino-4,6-dideoxygalactose transaminase
MNTGLAIPFTGLQRQYNNLRTEILTVTDRVLASGRLMDGQNTADFEAWLANKNHVKHAVTCHSGTQALEIIASFARQRLGINPPTVLVPSMTFPASANAFVRAGWNLHFIDTDAYGNLDLKKIDPDTSYQAILGIGLYGAALPKVLQNQMGVGLMGVGLIEDAAQHWLSNDCTRYGSTAISFDPMKNLGNYGNGGAIVTNDHELLNYARGWINNGKNTGHAEIGTNSRMSEVDCAQMLVKTKYLSDWQEVRRRIAVYLMDRFVDSPVRCLINETNVDKHCFHKFVVDIDNRDLVLKKMQAKGIDVKIHYAHPLHELSAYQHYQGPDMLSAASSLSRRCLSLPIYPELTDSEVEYVTEQLLDCVA